MRMLYFEIHPGKKEPYYNSTSHTYQILEQAFTNVRAGRNSSLEQEWPVSGAEAISFSFNIKTAFVVSDTTIQFTVQGGGTYSSTVHLEPYLGKIRVQLRSSVPSYALINKSQVVTHREPKVMVNGEGPVFSFFLFSHLPGAQNIKKWAADIKQKNSSHYVNTTILVTTSLYTQTLSDNPVVVSYP